MESLWWIGEILKPILAVTFGLCFSQCFLPLKQGLEKEDQKLINKGSLYLIISLASLLIIIFIFAKNR